MYQAKDKLKMKLDDLPPADILRTLLRYDPETGKLFWLERPLEMFPSKQSWRSWNSRHAGSEAFTASDGQGYLQGSVLKKRTRAHRVVWAICNSTWPTGQIDHRNGNRSDNRICNLKVASPNENQRNKCQNKNNTSGFNGVVWNKRAKKWHSRIKLNGAFKHLGSFDEKQDAIEARMQANNKHQFSARHGLL
jgi:hypothetical protein